MEQITEAEQEQVKIEKLVYGGDGLARLHGQVVLVPYVLPDETIKLATGRPKTGVLRGTALEILEPSPERVVARCEYFGACGGCHLQHMGYGFQLAQKEAILRETLRRIGNLDYKEAIRVVSAEPWNYRNRVQLHFKDGQLGFHRAGSHDLEPITHCEISAPILNTAIQALQGAVRRQEWPSFLRSLELFTNGEQIQLNVLESNRPVAARFFEWMKNLLPGMVDGAIDYPVIGQTFRVSGGSFFQINRFLIEDLVKGVLEDVSGVWGLDLYAGVGLFTLALAKRFERVDAVERNLSGFRDLQWNISHGGFTAVAGSKGSAEDFLRGLSTAPDFVLADPPRTGLGTVVVEDLLRLKPRRVTIVACDPATLARDLKKLVNGGYEIASMDLVDLFPQTYHFETVVKLRG